MRYIFRHAHHLRREEILTLFTRSIHENLAKTVFYDWKELSESKWLEYLHRTKSWLVRIENEQNGIVGFFWLNGFMGRSAQVHFCFFRDHMHASVSIVSQALRWLFTLGTLDSLYGVTPKPYRHVIKLFNIYGFRFLGEVEGVCFINKLHRYVPGIISTVSLKEV